MKLPFEKRQEIDNPVPLFRELLEGEVKEYRYDLRATEWFDEETYDLTDALWQEFTRDFQVIVNKLSLAIRKPDFNGSYEEKGYPEELEWAPHLAYWLYNDRALFVICDWQDKETPMVLGLGMKPLSYFTPSE